MPSNSLYADVTAKILAELEAGAAPWVKPWSSLAYGETMPRNAASRRAYSGVNVVLLWMAQQGGAYASSRWLTFKQALDLGGNVRKGEKGTTVVYVDAITLEEENARGELEEKRIPFLKRFTVFNVDQCDNLPDRALPPAPAPRNADAQNDLADQFLELTGANIVPGGEACYRPGADLVSLPPFAAFKNADNFYATAFHELGHWTGHKSRLARDLSGRFGNQAYAAEELVAELTSAFLCAEFAFDGDLRHAGYIENWIKLLRSDERAFVTACSKAQVAADFLREKALGAPAVAA